MDGLNQTHPARTVRNDVSIDRSKRETVLGRWYRQQLSGCLPLSPVPPALAPDSKSKA